MVASDVTNGAVRRKPIAATLAGICLLAYLVLLLRTAWVCDDSYISFRVLDNLLNGYGLRWNVDERVQAFSNPLWVFFLTPFYAASREIYYTSLLVSIGLSLTTFYLVTFKASAGVAGGFLAACVLMLSKAFVDYSTSGLENPLTHLLLALFCIGYLRKDLQQKRTVVELGLLASLLALNRLDNLLLCFPALIGIIATRRRWETVKLIAFASTPVFIWELFSLVYYGSFIPNTYYAKLNTGIPAADSIKQGVIYLADSLQRDPLTLATIAVAIVIASLYRKSRRPLFLSLGIVLYLIACVRAGGDFMSGRFLSSSILVSVIIIASSLARISRSKYAVMIALTIIVGLSARGSPVWSGQTYSDTDIPPNGIVDERGWYFQYTGLLRNLNGARSFHDHPWVVAGDQQRKRGASVTVWAAIGFFGYFAGPSVHIIDPYALSDSFLSRLPAQLLSRVGHYERRLPEGYYQTIKLNRNRFVHARLLELYRQTALIARGEIFSTARWVAISGLATALQAAPPSYEVEDFELPKSRWLGDATLYVDLINNSRALAIQQVAKDADVTIEGWAVDANAREPALAIALKLDGTRLLPARYGFMRPDVAITFGEPNYTSSGFKGTIPRNLLSRGIHTLEVEVTSSDGSGYYAAKKMIEFEVVAKG
jgi:arabinofuranosyltransferase